MHNISESIVIDYMAKFTSKSNKVKQKIFHQKRIWQNNKTAKLNTKKNSFKTKHIYWKIPWKQIEMLKQMTLSAAVELLRCLEHIGKIAGRYII